METQNEAGFLQVVSSHGVPFHNYSAVVSRLRQLVGPDAILFANEGVDLWDWDQLQQLLLYLVLVVVRRWLLATVGCLGSIRAAAGFALVV